MTSTDLDLPQNFGTGLEDFDSSDAVIPRLRIVQKEAVFEDNLTGQRFNSIDVIILGLVKQRVLWPAESDEGDVPMCKSPDHLTGFPNDDGARDKRFPWEKSGFNKDDYPEQENGLRALPCAGCQLKEWGSAPDGKKPWCAEQWALPVLYRGTDDDGEMFAPAILTLQRSGIKAIKAYLTPFQRQQSPAFVNVATIRLNLNKRGQVDYSTPTFAKGPATDRSEWGSFATQYMEIASFLKQIPTTEDYEGGSQPTPGQDNANTAPPQQQAPQQSPAPQQQPTVQGQVVQNQPPPQQQTEDPWQPPMQNEQPAQPAPQTPPPSPSQPDPTPSQPATQPQGQAPQDDDDDIPF